MAFDPDTATPVRAAEVAPSGFNPNTAAPVVNDVRADPVRPPGAMPYDVAPGLASLMNVGQAIVGGWGDEIAGGVGKLTGGDYLTTRDRYRATVDQFRREYPGSALLGSVSGGILPALVGGEAFALKNLSPLAGSMTVGAAQGAVMGAGDAPEIKDVPNDASRGSIYGAAGAPLLLGATMGGGHILSGLGNLAASHIPSVERRMVDTLARNRVAAAFNRDGEMPTQDRFDYLGNEARFVDLGGKNTRATLDVNASMPGTTGNELENFIQARQAGRAARLDPVVEMLRNGNGKAGEVFASWQAQKEMDAAPLYARATARSVPIDADLQSVLASADALGATKLGRDIATAYRMPFSLDPATGAGSMRDLDNVKKGIDQLLTSRAALNQDGSLTPLGAAYLDLKNKLVARLDKLTEGQDGISAYAQARDAYAGPQALQDALQAGRRFLSGSAEDLSSTMSGLSSSEREAFRIGAAESLRVKLGSESGQTEYMKAWKNRNIQERLQALFEDPAKYAQAMELLDKEGVLKRAESLGRGSQTAPRHFAGDDQAQSVAADAVELLGTSKAGVLGEALSKFIRNAGSLTTPEPVRNRIGSLLLSQSSPAEIAAIQKAQQAMKARYMAQLLAATGSAQPIGAAVVPGGMAGK